MTPLRLRMIDAMVLRGFAARTQETYLFAVGQMARHHHCSPELLSDEQIQAYLLYLLQERHRSRSTVNITSCATRFLVCEVLGQTERRPQIPMGRTPQRLPEVLSRAEVGALLAVPMSAKARTFLTTAYASGLRVSELCGLRGCDIDSAPDRMCIRVVQGKGGQDRYGLLTAELLDQLRMYWRSCRSHVSGADWLFPARSNPSRPLDRASGQRYYHLARDGAGITKSGGIHTLRHYSESRNMPRQPCRWSCAASGKAGNSLGIFSLATLRGVTGDDRDTDIRGSTTNGGKSLVPGVGTAPCRADAYSRIRAGVGKARDRACPGLRELAPPARDLRPEYRVQARG